MNERRPFQRSVATTFRIRETFELKSRGMLMVVGEIVEGDVRVGDRVSGLGRDLPVEAVEMLTRSDRSCSVALAFRYSDEAELAQLRQRLASSSTLTITAADVK
jgi:hypothetical protein